MAKKDDEPQAATDAEKVKAPKVHKEEAAGQTATATAVGAHTPPWPLITIGVVVTVVVLAIGGLWWLKFATLHTSSNRAAPTYGYSDRSQSRNDARGSMPGRGRGGISRATASGVVTAINGDTITIAGSGKQVTVKKTSDTIISGDESTIAVNDTVLVYGSTADDGTVTATRIMIRNSNLSSSDDSRPAI